MNWEMNQASNNVEAQEAKHGEKMIEIKVRFWTDGIEDAEKIRPKHAWSSGVVRVASNKSHAIVPGRPRLFNSLLELNSVIERVIIEHGIVLLPSDRTQRYMAEKPVKHRGKKKSPLN
jgi:hypothetical protein